MSDRLHPHVYKAVAGLALWFVLSAWVLFGGGDHMGLMLTLVSVLIFMAVAMPFALWLVWRKEQNGGARHDENGSFQDWAAGEFDTWQGRFKGTDAAIEVLLPIAAVAFGITAFGFVLQFTATGAA